MRNCYFKFGDKLFRQDIGIPMGSDPSPFFANLFLYHYESSWLKSIKKTNNTLARKFGNVVRYINDLLPLIDGQSFESFHHEIYPEELQLNKENVDNTETNFLDLHIKIDNKIFTTMLYDKRDHFGFNITKLPYRNSNIYLVGCSIPVLQPNVYVLLGPRPLILRPLYPLNLSFLGCAIKVQTN